MKLVTFKVHTEERIGALVGTKVLDLTSAYAVYLTEVEQKDYALSLASSLVPPNMKVFLERGNDALEAATKTLSYMMDKQNVLGLEEEQIWLDLDSVRLYAPIPSPGKVYCAALNFYDHATDRITDPKAKKSEIERLKSLKLDIPDIFQKPPSLVCGPRGPLIYPKITKQLDYECELAVIIGKRGKYIPKEQAYTYIAGYTTFIDMSYRDQGFPTDVDFRLFKRDINWTKTKGMDNAAPMGPCLLMKDAIPDPYNPPLKLITRVNGQIRQNGDLSTMIIDIPRLIEYLSSGTTLEPGDVIATGTISGLARSWPNGFLKVGDVLECEIPPIGKLKYQIMAE